MKCPRCDSTTDASARFCAHCGAELLDRAGEGCRSCGASLPPGAKFCPSCGSAVEGPSAPPAIDRDALARLIPGQYLDQLAAARGRPSGERRVVTILFFDVTGSTAMAEDLDPEDVMEIMNGAFEVLIEPIYHYEGTLARLMGDGVLAFFGAPISHEDDPARACRAALDVTARAREYADRLRRDRGIEGFDVRVGINTGLVVVGEVGADLRVEYTAMGDAVNLAARMESTADPGTVRITQDTQRLIASLFETESLGAIEVKGKSAPVNAYRLVGPKSTSVLTNEQPESAQMVGRDEELAELRRVLEGLRSGTGASVSIVGEAGFGKSRLILEARRTFDADQGSWVEGRCMPFARETSYWIAREMLHGLLGVDWGWSPEETERALARALDEALGGEKPPGALAASEARPLLAHLLGLPLDEPARQALARIPNEERSARLRRAYCGYVHGRSLMSPTVLVWEDLQWADEESLEIVESLCAVCDRAPLVVLTAFRPQPDTLARAAASPGHRVIEVAPLERPVSEDFVRSLVGGAFVPPKLIEEIIDCAGGNPFFLEQVVRSLTEVVDAVHSGWGVRNLSVPDTLHGAVQVRMDGLAPRDKNTLQVASVIGREFASDILESVCDDAESIHLGESLQELYRRGFLQAGQSSGERVHSFRQPMTAEVAYNSVLKSRRAQLHGRVGETIERMFPLRLDELSPVLAHHFDCAGVGTKVVEYSIRAARRASGMSANREAIRRYRRALELKSDAAIHEELGDIYFVVGNYRAAMEQYERAGEGLGDESHRTTLYRKMGQLHQRWGKHDEATAFFETAQRSMRKPLDTTEAAHIYSGLGMARYHRGDLEEALALTERALEMMTNAGDPRGTAQAENNLGIIHAKRESWEEAVDRHRRALSIWERAGDDYGMAASYNNLGLALRGSGDLEEAVHSFEKSLELFEKIGNRHGLACAYDNLGQVRMDREEMDLAMECLKKAVGIMAEISVDKSEIIPEMWQAGAW